MSDVSPACRPPMQHPLVMNENPFLSLRPVSLPIKEARVLDYRVIEFRREGQVRFIGNCRLDGAADAEAAAVRIFFRPPQPGRNEENARLLPEQPVAPDNADMFLTKLGLEAVTIPSALTDPCVIDLDLRAAALSCPAVSNPIEG